MTHADIILLILLGGFTLFGLYTGLIHALGALVGVAVGAFFASRFYGPIADWLIPITGGNPNWVKVVVFILVFIIVNRLVGFAFWIVEKIFGVLKVIPFLSTINRLLGAILGLSEGVLVIGLTLYFISKFPLGETLTAALAASSVAAYLIKISAVLWPLLPLVLRQIQSVF